MTRRPSGRPNVLSGAALPHALLDLPRPPEEAYLWGRLPPGPRVGLVGTREPSARGFRIAYEVARRLAALGITIVSGGALGIDRAAHLGALRARGSTLVVAPVWLDRPYPEKNRRLFERVIERGGGYLTDAQPAAVPFHPTFARRNELLVALCDVVLFGEMGVPSGALMAARFARRSGVPRLTLPWSLETVDLRGTESELERGASPFFNAVQIVRLLEGRAFDNPVYWERSLCAQEERAAALEAKSKRRRGSKKKAGARKVGRNPKARASSAPEESDPVWRAISSGATTIDAIADQTGLAAAVVQHRVLTLTLEGVVIRDQSGLLRVRRAPP